MLLAANTLRSVSRGTIVVLESSSVSPDAFEAASKWTGPVSVIPGEVHPAGSGHSRKAINVKLGGAARPLRRLD